MSRHKSASTDHGVCPSCHAVLRGTYCHECGEKKLSAGNYSIVKFIEESIDVLTHYDSKLYRSLRLLISKPGFLTTEFFKGRRVPYVKPVQLFVIVNILYFLAVSVFGWNTFATRLEIHRTNGYYGSFARSMVDVRLAERGVSVEQFQSTFDHASATSSKTLIFTMIPFLALVLQGLYWRPKRYYLEDLVFSVHFFSFLLIYLAGVAILIRLVLLLIGGIFHLDILGYIDYVGSIVGGLGILLYLSLALKRARNQSSFVSFVKAGIVTYVLFWVLWIYRFILFLTCFYFF